MVLAVLNEGLTVLREYIAMTSDRRDKLEGASNRPRDDVVGGRTPSTDGDGSKTAVSLEQLDEHDHRQYVCTPACAFVRGWTYTTRKYSVPMVHAVMALPAGQSEASCAEAATICPRTRKLTFDPLTLKVVSESRVTWPTSTSILVFLGLSVLDLGSMYATERRQTQTSRSEGIFA